MDSHLKHHLINEKGTPGRTPDHLSGLLERSVSANSLSQTLRGLAISYEKELTKGEEEAIFEMFKIPGREVASIGRLLMILKSFGLRMDDPRLRPMMRYLKEIEKQEEAKRNEVTEPKHWKLSKEQFKECVAYSVDLISQALQNNFVIPSWSEFVNQIKIFYLECHEIRCGSVATYIPQLARQSPDKWGVSICTVDGQRASFGDSKTAFCVQSVAKAFNYAIAASDLGADYVHSYVGHEPSGRFFNEICLDAENKPHNPMVNSGAIIVTSLIKSTWNMADRFDYMITEYRKIAGGEYIGFNNATFLSERATADRNYALSYFMKEKKCFPPEAFVQSRTKKCIDTNPCRDVLSLMYSCGMYDASGQFSFAVGLPAKSGVSGVMIVVVPNVMGIALWSPPLDKMGNSTRGVAFCKKLIGKFNFHNYDCLLHTTSNKVDPRRREVRERDSITPAMNVARSKDMVALRRSLLTLIETDSLRLGSICKEWIFQLVTTISGHHCMWQHVRSDLTMVKFLVNVAKVDVTVHDRWDRTALDDARFFKHNECVQFLEAATKKSDCRPQSISSVESEDDMSLKDDDRPTFTIDNIGNS
ncbi:hypothetical protein KIN20_025274 [Parelaphostrongylus tenuis]|uniref:glutaminase n=1 Tax=Parelaphostrongylus tenuis TaxID=148309 RepID=A0AAD5MV04_PARTN|nr:hypothetical protein KIN20_025274 [Parelaphostrongylus tenuis]